MQNLDPFIGLINSLNNAKSDSLKFLELAKS